LHRRTVDIGSEVESGARRSKILIDKVGDDSRSPAWGRNNVDYHP